MSGERRAGEEAGAESQTPLEARSVRPGAVPHPRRRVLIAAVIAAVALASCLLFYQRRAVVKPIAADSLAILPLKTLTRGSADDFLSLGVTDALISKMGALGTVDIRPLSAVHQYRDMGADAVTAGRRLHVDAVLDGTVQRNGDRVRLNLRLVEVASGRQVWSNSYDEQLGDLFATQERISRAVFDALSVRLTPQSPVRRYATADPYVVEMYLRGKYHFSRRRQPDFQKSIDAYRRALARDESFAPAWAALGDSLNFVGKVDEAKAAARRALQLDPTLADAHATLGNALFFHDRDLDAAEREFETALQLNPSCTNARHWYSYLLAVRGRMPEAMRELEAARHIDPLSLPLNTSAGSLHYLAGRFDEAIAAYRRALDLDPEYVQARLELALAYAAKGDTRAAEEQLGRLPATSRGGDLLAAYLAAIRGDRSTAQQTLQRTIARAHTAAEVTEKGFWVAAALVALGNQDAAIDWLAKAFDGRGGDAALIGIDPKFRALHGNARFRELVRRAMG